MRLWRQSFTRHKFATPFLTAALVLTFVVLSCSQPASALTSNQQAKRKLVFHFLWERSYHLTGAKSYNVCERSAIGSERIFYNFFTMSF